MARFNAPTAHHVTGFGWCYFDDDQLRAAVTEYGTKTLSEMSDYHLHRTGITIPLEASLFDALAMVASILSTEAEGS